MFHDLCIIGGKVCSELIGKSYLLLLDLFVKVFHYFEANDQLFVERDRVFVVILECQLLLGYLLVGRNKENIFYT